MLKYISKNKRSIKMKNKGLWILTLVNCIIGLLFIILFYNLPVSTWSYAHLILMLLVVILIEIPVVNIINKRKD